MAPPTWKDIVKVHKDVRAASKMPSVLKADDFKNIARVLEYLAPGLKK